MTYIFESVNCVICGADNYDQISSSGQFNLPISLVLCRECGLGYLNPRWDNQSYFHFYSHDYDKYYRPKIGNMINSEANRLNPIIDRIEKNNLMPQEVQNILDIGSGEGKNLRSFKKIFPKSSLNAIEPSKKSQKLLKDFNVNIISEDINADWESKYVDFFDIIILRHVLEHFLDPVKILKKVSSVINSKGIVYIAVPNNLIPTQNLEQSWFRVVHTYYFNKYSLKNILYHSNFEIVTMVEGDEYNRGEVFLIAKRIEKSSEPEISKRHYEIQKEVFDRTLKKERSFLYRLIFNAKKNIRRVFLMKN